MPQKINVATEFYKRLVNRDHRQGDGKHTAVEFREKYLKFLENEDTWNKSLQDTPAIILDFSNIKKIGPSFANEAFAYFTKYAKPEQILTKIKFINISNVQNEIITMELVSGYSRK